MPDSWSQYIHTARICSTVFGSVGKAVPLKDFLPDFEKGESSRVATTKEGMKNLLQSVAIKKKPLDKVEEIQ